MYVISSPNVILKKYSCRSYIFVNYILTAAFFFIILWQGAVPTTQTKMKIQYMEDITASWCNGVEVKCYFKH